MDCDLTECHKGTFEVPLGKEGFREIDSTLIIKTIISWYGFFGQPHLLLRAQITNVRQFGVVEGPEGPIF